MTGDFSYKTREVALRSFRQDKFDLLVVGGGIIGAAVARDAASRGLRVALVEKNDFAFGTSSRSSKLIHGGLRYLENLEFGLVFEALAERAFLLKTMPHMVRTLPFYLPVYEGDPNGRGIRGLGLWLYDLLALFRTPGFHRSLSKKRMVQELPCLKAEGLLGGFRYYDASMWDDAIAIETLRSAAGLGAQIANYVEALAPIWKGDVISGFRVRDRETGQETDLRATRVVVCAGPWTDGVGSKLATRWQPWLSPSKGVHLVFDLKRIPIPGALVMSHPEDGRISFVIPRSDLGAGVVIVGTTDGPAPLEPEKAEVLPEDVRYLLDLLHKYFPDLKLGPSDILSAYVGVRPLMDPASGKDHGHPDASSESLKKISREHHIDLVAGGVVVVAGGKYTTHRRMAEEIVDFAIRAWKADAKDGKCDPVPLGLGRGRVQAPVNPRATPAALKEARFKAAELGVEVPEPLFERYGAEALDVVALGSDRASAEGFPYLEAQLRQGIRSGMVLHLEDFYLRRVPLHAARADHGLPWAERLAAVWAEECELGPEQARQELQRLHAEIERRSIWKGNVS